MLFWHVQPRQKLGAAAGTPPTFSLLLFHTRHFLLHFLFYFSLLLSLSLFSFPNQVWQVLVEYWLVAFYICGISTGWSLIFSIPLELGFYLDGISCSHVIKWRFGGSVMVVIKHLIRVKEGENLIKGNKIFIRDHNFMPNHMNYQP